MIKQCRLRRRLGLGLGGVGGVGEALEDLPDAVEAVGVLRALVPADALDPGETQGEAAVVAIAPLDLIACDLQDDLRLDSINAPVLGAGELEEQIRELLDLLISHAAVRLADVDQ